MKTVLILCTGNSCRSQMAEAIINYQLGDAWRAYSAGTEPSGYVHPKAIAALEEIGIHHQGVSKHIDALPTQEFDSAITVCGDAEEKCPAWLGQGVRKHIGFPDPAKAEGDEETVMGVFRTVRDDIQTQIPAYLGSLG